MQGIRVPYLVQADATCLRATTEPAHPEPVLHKRSHCSEKPSSTTRAWPLLAVTRESLSSDKDPAQPKKKNVSRLSLGLFLSLCPGIYGLNSHISPREVTPPRHWHPYLIALFSKTAAVWTWSGSWLHESWLVL